MRDIELGLVIELLKNSNRSDRELAKAIGVSQPTATRTRRRLEEQRIIKEYTIIPDFQKLDLALMSITFTKMVGQPSEEDTVDLKKRASNMMNGHPSALILGNTGMGCDADYVAIAFHRDYSEYSNYMKDIKNFPRVNIDEIQSFLINLLDKNQFQPLSFYHLAGYLAKAKENPRKKKARA